MSARPEGSGGRPYSHLPRDVVLVSRKGPATTARVRGPCAPPRHVGRNVSLASASLGPGPRAGAPSPRPLGGDVESRPVATVDDRARRRVAGPAGSEALFLTRTGRASYCDWPATTPSVVPFVNLCPARPGRPTCPVPSRGPRRPPRRPGARRRDGTPALTLSEASTVGSRDCESDSGVCLFVV